MIPFQQRMKVSVSALLRKIMMVCALTLLAAPQIDAAARTYTIMTINNPSYMEKLAAKEIRRFLYQRTGEVMPLIKGDALPQSGDYLIVVATKGAALLTPALTDAAAKTTLSGLLTQQYLLFTQSNGAKKTIIVAGGDSLGTLYGAYGFCEKLGVWFDLDCDVIPDSAFTNWTSLDALNETQKPLFDVRGILPFHDFPEGPDWWDLDDYKMYESQLAKMKMNLISLHTYPDVDPTKRTDWPEGWIGENAEPTVWIGSAENVNADGTVKKSYPAWYASTARNGWAYFPKNTSDYSYGASQIFETDSFASEFMDGLLPKPKNQQEYNQVFNKSGELFNKAFTWAKKNGVRTCTGTKAPLVIPDSIKETGITVQQAYEGIFTRIKRTHPLDYYWTFTPEEWVWGNGGPSEDEVRNDMKISYDALKKVLPGTIFGTSGWILGSPGNANPWNDILGKECVVSGLSTWFGGDRLSGGYGEISGRPKWAIGWLEDDARMIQPQPLVKRWQRDANDALKYNCTGLIGLHWRTKVTGPNVAAMAQLSWNQTGWTAEKFYADWALAHFGSEAATDIGKVFTDLDGFIGEAYYTFWPASSCWGGDWGDCNNGPGCICNGGDENFDFVDKLAGLRSMVKGKGNLDRFDYWLNQFNYWREIGKKTDNAKIWKYLVASIYTKGEMGTLMNIEAHNFWKFRGPKEYNGDNPRIVMTTVRTNADLDEVLNLKVRILATGTPQSVTLYSRLMGAGQFTATQFTHVNRGVYSIALPKVTAADLEYYVELKTGDGKTVTNPPSAPLITYTVIAPDFIDLSVTGRAPDGISRTTHFIKNRIYSNNPVSLPFYCSRPAQLSFRIYCSDGRSIKSMEKKVAVSGESSIELMRDGPKKLQSGTYLVEMIDRSNGRQDRLDSWRIVLTR